jgi:hypothetical protein
VRERVAGVERGIGRGRQGERERERENKETYPLCFLKKGEEGREEGHQPPP